LEGWRKRLRRSGAKRIVAVVWGTEGGVVERGVGDGFTDVLDGTLDWLHDHLNRRDVDTLLANVLHFGGELGPGLKCSDLAEDQISRNKWATTYLYKSVAQLPELALVADTRILELHLLQSGGQRLVCSDNSVAPGKC
jgi:hypothetical protein